MLQGKQRGTYLAEQSTGTTTYIIRAICHGIVTADVLVQRLSRGAIAARKLKGVKRDNGHEGYTGSAPYGEGKSLLQLRWNY